MQVLIAEDSASYRHLLDRLLTSWGYQVRAVENGREAWRLLQDPEGPQLAVLDWIMPEMDGPAVCRAVRELSQPSYRYLLLLTAKDQKEEVIEGLESGADDYLVKPPNSYELKARLNTGRRIIELQNQLRAANEALKIQATRDALTGVWNRGAILELLEREWANGRRTGAALGVLLVDLDHFKKINDTHGHLAGDAVLRQAAQRMQESLRPGDLLGRYGGEEFLVVLPGCGPAFIAGLAERLRVAVNALQVVFADQPIPVTTSVGAAAVPLALDGPVAVLVSTADAALYRAKAAGRNRIEVGRVAIPGRE